MCERDCWCRFIDDNRAPLVAAQLRLDKATGNRRRAGVSEHIEIVLVPKDSHGLYTIYPALFIFTTPARMIRPVRNLITQTTEYIGTFEQVYLGICITHDEFVPGVSQMMIFFLRNDLFSAVYHSSRTHSVQFLVDYC